MGFWKWVGGAAGSIFVAVMIALLTHWLIPSDNPAPKPTPSAAGAFSPVAQPTEVPTSVPVAPEFVLVSSNWTGGCTPLNGCPMAATFKNLGGPGSSSVTFYVVMDGNNVALSSCTTAIPHADTGETVSASCTADTGPLGQFIADYVGRYGPGPLPLHIDTRVN